MTFACCPYLRLSLLLVCGLCILLFTLAIPSALDGVKGLEGAMSNADVRDSYNKQVNRLKLIQPLGEPSEKIMFWRPQKVGSSTVLSILVSYSFRYNKLPRVKSFKNFMCAALANCAIKNITAEKSEGKYSKKLLQELENYDRKSAGRVQAIQKQRAKLSEKIPNSFSLSHEICNFDHNIIQEYLPCIYKGNHHRVDNKVKEIFVLRDPLARMISIYYFWGELFRIRVTQKIGRKPKQIGSNSLYSGKIEGTLFTYHGNESSSPPKDIALVFANKFPLFGGNPGPSHTWSLFADNLKDSLKIVKTDRIFTIVTERLDESLVAASEYMQWKLPDLIPTLPRKSLSTHPKHNQWPQEAIKKLKEKLEKSGEYDMYFAANATLDRRIEKLKKSGFDFDGKVVLFKQLKERVQEICLTPEYLALYKAHLLSLGLNKHHNQNKLRDSDASYVDDGHLFDWNMELLFDYDVCGNCEAHAIMAAIDNNLATSPSNSPLLKDLDDSLTSGKIEFQKCPKKGVPGLKLAGSKKRRNRKEDRL